MHGIRPRNVHFRDLQALNTTHTKHSLWRVSPLRDVKKRQGY